MKQIWLNEQMRAYRNAQNVLNAEKTQVQKSYLMENIVWCTKNENFEEIYHFGGANDKI